MIQFFCTVLSSICLVCKSQTEQIKTEINKTPKVNFLIGLCRARLSSQFLTGQSKNEVHMGL